MFNKRQIRELEESVKTLKIRLELRDRMLSDNDFTFIQMNKTNSKLHEKIKFYENSVQAYDQQERILKEQLRVANEIIDLFQHSIDSLTEEVNRKDDDIESLLYELYNSSKEKEKLKQNVKYGTLKYAICPECSRDITDLLGDLYDQKQTEKVLRATICFGDEIQKLNEKMIKKLKEKLDKH